LIDPNSFFQNPLVSDLIRHKARRLAQRTDFRGHDADDVEQELRLKLARNLDRFDPSRGNERSFIVTVVERHAASLVRRQEAHKRNPARDVSLDRPGNGASDTSFGSTFSDRQHAEQLGRRDRPAAEAADLRQDIAELLGRFPPELQQLARDLMTASVTETARQRNCPRTSLYSDIGRIRRRFERGGLDKYLEDRSSP
jgi:RNA polymerase sigma factor (sigma-70 family)